MEGMSIVMAREYREMRQGSAFRIMLIVTAVIAAAAAIIISITLSRQAWLPEPDARPVLELIMGLVAYYVPLFLLMAFIWAFAGFPVTREKVNGNIECLLATPISPAAIWLGKTLAIFLPGFAASVLCSAAALAIINLSVVMPATGGAVLPLPAMLVGLLINPLLLFALVAFIILFSMAGNPDVAIAPSFLLGFGLMIGMMLGVSTGFINLASWAFALWYAAGTAALWGVVLAMTRMLTRTNIVLSSKGA